MRRIASKGAPAEYWSAFAAPAALAAIILLALNREPSPLLYGCMAIVYGVAAIVWFELSLRSDVFEKQPDSGRATGSASPAEPDDLAAEKSTCEEAPSETFRQRFLKEVSANITSGVEYGVLATFKWADYDRMAGLDPAAAERFLAAFHARLASVISKSRIFAETERNAFSVWITGDPINVASELRAIEYALHVDLETVEGKLACEAQLLGSFYPNDASDPSVLLNRARISAISFEHKDGVLALRPTRPATMFSEDFALEKHLRRAIERNELELHYQPIIDARHGRLIGAEALLRWTSRELGPVTPNRFIPAMERIGLADDIGAWVLNQACKRSALWRSQGCAPWKIAINVSHKQISNSSFERAIAAMLNRYEVDPGLIELELTESAATKNISRTKEFFEQMAKLGVRIAIDDFGTGYSSLSYLKQLRFNKLKIDREFVSHVETSADSQAICKSLIALADGLEIDVVAEGTETRAEVDYMLGIGCPFFQGYYFSKPLPADEFLAFANERSWRIKLDLGAEPALQQKLA